MAYKDRNILRDRKNQPVPQYFNVAKDEFEPITSDKGMLRIVPVDTQGEAIPFKDLVDQIDNKLDELIKAVNPDGI